MSPAAIDSFLKRSCERARRFPTPTGIALSEAIKGTVFDGDRYVITLPECASLDDVDSISAWCVDAGLSFGAARFDDGQ